MIHQLVYQSAAIRAFTEDELIELLQVARNKNPRYQVTGMLLYHEGAFIQVIEGGRLVVERLFDKVRRDPRHDAIRVLARAQVPERLFGEWSMGFLRVNETTAVPEGLNEFLKGIGSAGGDSQGVAPRLLEGFREGRWRASIEG